MQPGQFNPKGEDWIGRELAELRKELRELKAANVFGLTGITPKDGGTDFDGYVNVNGPMSITGALNLPAGIIGNDALTSPAETVAGHADTFNFSLATGANAEKLRVTFTVPPGFTKASVYGTATMTASNNSGALDYCYLAFRVNGAQVGWSNQVAAPDSMRVLDVASGAGVVTGLEGGELYVSAEASSGFSAWAANENNTLNIDALVTFYR